MSRTELLRLDDLRYDDHARALRQVKGLIRSGNVEPQDLALAYGVLASCFRMSGKLHLALKTVDAGIRFARKEQQPLGDLLQRFSVAVSNLGQYTLALWLSAEAAVQHIEAADQLGVAKTLVDRGIFLGHLEQIDRGIECFSLALTYDLKKESPRNFIAALHGNAILYARLGNIGRARQYLSEALAAASPGQKIVVMLWWLEGSLSHSEGDLERAEKFLSKALDSGRCLTTINLALLAVEYVELLHLRGADREAAQAAQDLARFFDIFEKNPLVEGLVAKLIRAAVTMQLSTELTLHLREELKSEAEAIKRRRASRSAR